MAEDEKVPDDKQCVAPPPTKRAPGKRAQDAIPGILGKQLRAAYGELLNAPIPDAISDLIKRLDSTEADSSGDPQKKPRREEQGQ
jgi:anti-sigma factor NepR-like protein